MMMRRWMKLSGIDLLLTQISRSRRLSFLHNSQSLGSGSTTCHTASIVAPRKINQKCFSSLVPLYWTNQIQQSTALESLLIFDGFELKFQFYYYFYISHTSLTVTTLSSLRLDLTWHFHSDFLFFVWKWINSIFDFEYILNVKIVSFFSGWKIITASHHNHMINIWINVYV